mmetsp:Transcript_23833/g.39399  ORF Transcript_23833/g.39399 Transcript_23833/m.39399 type:complete len:207 (+) Transcript_23833:694-1314(+)
MLEHADRLAVPCAPVAHYALEPLYSLYIVCVHVETRGGHFGDTIETGSAIKVGREALEAHRWLDLFDSSYNPGVMVGTTVEDIITIDRSDDNVVNRPRRYSLRSLLRFIIGRARRLTRGLDVAKAAPARACVPEHHYCCCCRTLLTRPALTDVWAACFLTDSCQLACTQAVANSHVIFTTRPLDLEPFWVPCVLCHAIFGRLSDHN